MIYLSQVCKGNHTPIHSISQIPLAVRKSKAVASKICKGNLAIYQQQLIRKISRPALNFRKSRYGRIAKAQIRMRTIDVAYQRDVYYILK